MRKELLRVLLVGGIVISSLACAAQRPILYPNEHLEAAGTAAAQQDIDDCLQRAAEAGYESRPGGKIASSTAVGGATGAAVGAAVGAVAGSAGQGAAMGAAGGGAWGLIRGLFRSRDLNPVQKQLVEKCLHEKGYQVMGWQ
jgi:outer membrane lipoprotein SlyB